MLFSIRTCLKLFRIFWKRPKLIVKIFLNVLKLINFLLFQAPLPNLWNIYKCFCLWKEFFTISECLKHCKSSKHNPKCSAPLGIVWNYLECSKEFKLVIKYSKIFRSLSRKVPNRKERDIYKWSKIFRKVMYGFRMF